MTSLPEDAPRRLTRSFRASQSKDEKMAGILKEAAEKEQAWLDAEVTAIRNELASTQIHQEVLDKRRRMLQARLASLGMGAADEAAY